MTHGGGPSAGPDDSDWAMAEVRAAETLASALTSRPARRRGLFFVGVGLLGACAVAVVVMALVAWSR